MVICFITYATKLDLLEQNYGLNLGILLKRRTLQFAEVLFKIKNAISHSIFAISTKFFQVSTPLDVFFSTHYKKNTCILKT